MILAWINWIDRTGVSVTTDSASAKLPVANVADPSPSKPWRTVATSAYAQFDLGAAREIGVLAAAGLTLAATDTIRVRLGTSLGAGDVLDQSAAGTIDAATGQWVYVPASAETAQYLRIDVAAASRASEGYFDFGRLWAAAAWSPGIGIAYPFDEREDDHSLITRAERSGVAVVDETWRQRVAAFALNALTETEALDDLRGFERSTGRRGQVLFVRDEDSARIAEELLIGRMRRASGLRYPRLPYRSKSFEIEEDK